MTDEPLDERPWTEDEWERFMQKSDARSAKFGELLETLSDDPDKYEIIAREMGWDHSDEEDEDDDDSELDAEELNDTYDDEDWDDIERLDHEQLDAIPAYYHGQRWGMAVHAALKDYLDGDEELEPDDPLVVAYADSLVVAAKIAGGHGMGYEDDVLCGNIVCCKQSLKAANRSVAALEELAEKQTVSVETIQPLVDEGRQVRALVEQYIAQLRARVWWQ